MPLSKAEFRRAAADRRRGLSPFVLEQVTVGLADWMYQIPVDLSPGDTVAAYVPMRAEPGSSAMLDALADRGLRVLLPVVPPGEPARLDWAVYTSADDLVEGRWGLREPGGERLGPDAIFEAKAVLVPAVAVDRHGERLGKGAGYYDRTLEKVTAPLIAVVYDDEIVEELPSDTTDVPMDWALTAERGFVRLGPDGLGAIQKPGR